MQFNIGDWEHGYPAHPKVWGRELWLANHTLYCAKLLIVEPGWMCSLHRHIVKDETFYVLAGEGLELMYGTDSQWMHLQRLDPGDCHRLMPGTWHRFWNIGTSPVVVLEVSTTHSEDDVERLEPSGKLLPF